ncbi:MAG: hypothetical protein KatS3mg031_0842 [Chitinophagales bacterium]|nr:MAG: hypothetical protein KatS3mg031_0842 [Chitinophagales bacterium]
MSVLQIAPVELREAFYEPLRHMVLILDVSGKIRYINSKGAQLLRRPRHDIIGKNWLQQFVPDEYHADILKRIRKAIRQKEIVESYEHYVKCGDNQNRIIKWHNNLITDPDGNVVEILKTGEDVTQQRENEKKLAESEENYRALVENIYQVAYRVDFPPNIKKVYPRLTPTFTTQRVEEFTGFPAKAFHNGTVIYLNRVHPDDREAVRRSFFKMIETRKAIHRTYRFRHKNGSYRWFEDTIIPIPNAHNIVTGCYGVVHDITDRVRHLATIREYEKFFSLSQDMFCIAGTDGYFKKINPSFERILGYSSRQLLKVPFIEYVHPDDVQKTQEVMQHLAAGGITIDFENRYRCKDGSYKWLSWTCTPSLDSDLLYAAARDITLQKIHEERLRKSEAFLSSVIENIPAMIFIKDAVDLKFARLNKAGETLLGYSEKELLGKTDYDFFPKSEADFFTRIDREVLRKRKLYVIPEEKIKTRLKGERILHTRKIPLYDQQGNPEYLLGISIDITDRKKAEELIKENEQKLIEAQKIAHVGSWEVDLKSETLTLSEEACRLFGLKNKKKLTRKEFRNLIHPEDRALVAELVETAVKLKDSFETEVRVIRPDGSLRYLLTRGRPMLKNKKVVKIIGTGLDISERKQTQFRIMKALVSGQDYERRRIAEDLHDSLGQKLSAIKLSVENISSRNGLKHSELNRLSALLNEAIEEVRNISHNLIPAGLHEFGIKNTLHNLCHRLQSTTGMHINFQAYGLKKPLDKTIELAIYRIAQELINNAMKHAQANEISVQLFGRSKQLILTVEDDGIGFDKKVLNSDKSFGLQSIASRTMALSGNFEIDTHPGKGTIASIQIPLHQPKPVES